MQNISPSHEHTARVGKATGRLHNFGMGTRWVVRPDGQSYGSYTGTHESLAKCAGYKNAEQAYEKGALRVHYDPATKGVRIEGTKVTPRAIALAKQIIAKIPSALAHVALGEGDTFRSYMGEPRTVVAQLSRKTLAPSSISVPHLAWASMYANSAEWIA